MTTLRHSEEHDWPSRRKQVQPTLDEVLPRVIQKKLRGGKSKQHGSRRPTGAKPEKERIPGVRAVHRLDRDTSGLMVFARTPLAEQHLVQQFRKHTVVRSYVTVAHGDVRSQTIESDLVRDRGDGRRGSTTLGKEVGQHAVTHVKPLEHYGYLAIPWWSAGWRRGERIRFASIFRNWVHVICGDAFTALLGEDQSSMVLPKHYAAVRCTRSISSVLSDLVTGETIRSHDGSAARFCGVFGPVAEGIEGTRGVNDSKITR